VRTNVDLPRMTLDNVARRLRASGRTPIEIGDDVDWWELLFGSDLALTRLVHPDRLVDEARRAMAGADLALVHICATDSAGHKTGAASPQYRAAAIASDEKVRALARELGWPNVDVVVVSDHGHTMYGGHGGDEPEVRRAFFVASGPSFARGAHIPDARPVDVAPTLAAALGVSAPIHAQGRTLVEALAIDDGTRRALTVADAARHVWAFDAAARGQDRHRSTETRRRAARAAAVAVVAVLLFVVLRRAGRAARAGMVAGALCLAGSTALYVVWFGRVSFSADRDASTLAGTTTLLAAGVTAAVLLWPLVRVLRGRLSAADACAFGLAAVAGASPLAALAFVYAGAYQPRIVCEPAWIAVGPLLVYAMFVPTVLAAASLSGLAAVIESARRLVRRSSAPARRSLPRSS
jgi:hypothetical protein